MDIIDLLPVIVPMIIMQLLIQAFYIKHCWENTELSQKQKVIYIIAIALFHNPAAAVYLFLTRKRAANHTGDTTDTEIDNHIRQGIFVLLIIAFEIFSMRIIFQNIESEYYSLIIGLLGMCFVIMLINGLIIKKQHALLYYLLPAIMVLLIMPVEYLDAANNTPFIVLVVIAGIINGFPLRLIKIYSIGAFVIYFAVNTAKAFKLYGVMYSDEIISYIYVNLLVFFLVFITFYTLNKQLHANKRLEVALTTLKEQSLQLERMSVMAERNRITGEIHDNVGHTLTSAVIAIEAGEKLINKDIETALEKFSMAKDQVKLGLRDIRSSVRAIHTGVEKAFIPAMESIIDEINQNTGLHISHIIKLTTDLLPIQQNVLLRAVKECTTNSLKHGSSTEADLLLQEYKGRIWMTFSDNGKGSANVVYGFGLHNMTKRVESIGGTMTVDSTKGEGFTVSISIPVGTRTGGDHT